MSAPRCRDSAMMASDEEAGMSGPGDTGTGRANRAGVWSAVLGLVALAAFGWLWALTATPLDPPNWMRIIGIFFFPIGVVGAIITGISGMRNGDRRWALIGMIAAAIAVIGFVLLITLWQY